MVLNNFLEKTNLFIIGDTFKKVKNYKMNDSFIDLPITIGEENLLIGTIGSFSILTEKELADFIIENDILFDNDYYYNLDIINVLYIKDYIGNIQGILKNKNSEEIDFSKLEYIYWNSSYCNNFRLFLNQSNFVELEFLDFKKICFDLKSFYIREKKIDEILK